MQGVVGFLMFKYSGQVEYIRLSLGKSKCLSEITSHKNFNWKVDLEK